MFKKAERFEIESIESISIGFGIVYQLKFTEFPNPKPIKKEINGKMSKLIEYSNISLEGFIIDSVALAGKNKTLLEGLDLSTITKMEIPPSLSNELMDKIDSLGIKINETFYLKKDKTDNKYKPNLIVEKK